MTATAFSYRGLTHPDAEIELTRYYKQAKFTKRGVRESTVIGMFLKGWVVAEGGAAISARILEIETAYAVDGGDAVLKIGGVETPHVLKSSHPACISGVKVVNFQWVTENPAEYVTNRSFTVQLEAEYADASSQTKFWYEQLEFIGNTGTRWRLVELPIGPPVPVIMNQQTKQTIIQSGKSVGFLGYKLPFGPLWPDSEHGDLRRFTLGSPQWNGQAFTDYPCEWTYFHSRIPYTEGTPTLQ
jgi:hypothetical protein